jgi:hypothetical protein
LVALDSGAATGIVVPRGADGDALRRVAADGNDMDSPMFIDFPIVVRTATDAERFASTAREHGFETKLWKHVDNAEWDVICAIKMTPTYDEIVRTQADLNTLAKPFGGYSDGWGTFGNRSGTGRADQ